VTVLQGAARAAAKRKAAIQGIKLAAISYYSHAILNDLAERHKIDFPLLAYPKSKIIASYGVLNAEATGMMKGMALPGYYYVDHNGIIRDRYFEAKYTDRFTASYVLAKLFPEPSSFSQCISGDH